MKEIINEFIQEFFFKTKRFRYRKDIKMLYQITDGTVSLGGNVILDHINFEIKGKEKIAITGKNGAGKTTLLRLLVGELELDSDDKRTGPGIFRSRAITMGMLRQQVFSDDSHTVEEELLRACPSKDLYARERYEYEKEYDRLFTGFGLKREDKARPLSSFSGGECTKIALIRLLLEKPDILILDEPTNHLDIETVEWLENYLKQYQKAVIMVSHDRFFLDQTADIVYELSGKKLVRYPGNYTYYREEKRRRIQIQQKAYQQQQEEIKRLEELVERFKHKPRKAAFARSKKKAMERMVKVEKPMKAEGHIFTGDINPLIPGSKWVFQSKHLFIGYDSPLLELTMRIRRGQKIGILGPNGAGKTTFLKTVAGLCPPYKGEYSLGNHTVIGYFDQHSAQITSERTVMEHFHRLFPALTEKEVRTILGAYLFGGKEAAKKVSSLSGGEKARLVLAELLQSRPNFLILDEPTNHMDVQAKETLESAFQAYTGTILFVSHDRYFMKQVAEAVLIFEKEAVMYYPFGYEHYLEQREKQGKHESIAAQVKAEDQALIAGMRAVPKAEHHQLREIPTETAYVDWKQRLAKEALDNAEKNVENIVGKMEKLWIRQIESEAFWQEVAYGDSKEGTDREKRWEDERSQKIKELDKVGQVEAFRKLKKEQELLEQQYKEAMVLWHKCCMEWAEEVLEWM